MESFGIYESEESLSIESIGKILEENIKLKNDLDKLLENINLSKHDFYRLSFSSPSPIKSSQSNSSKSFS